MKTIAKHLCYIVIGITLFAFVMGLQWAFDILWTLYVDYYFVAVNRTIAVIIVVAACWFLGCITVSDYIKTSK